MGADMRSWCGSPCPLWVITGHCAASARCPPYLQKRTSAERIGMSVKCQKQTPAPQQRTHLFDHVVGDSEERRRDGHAEHGGGLIVDDQLELVRLHDRYI